MGFSDFYLEALRTGKFGYIFFSGVAGADYLQLALSLVQGFFSFKYWYGAGQASHI
mgnify:CR=1 FL=1